MMPESVARTPLADAWRHAMSLMPVLGRGLAVQADPGTRHRFAAVSARRWTEELSAVQEAQVAYIREGTERTSDAMARLLAAREPTEAMAAGVGPSLALATVSAAPLRAWLDGLPKLQACCAAENGASVPTPLPGSDAAPAPTGKTASPKPGLKEGSQ